jgi:chromate transporter
MPIKSGSAGEVFAVMARLGCFAFGGPVAHLAHFQKELIEKRKWIGESEYADLIAFSQFLPGPASTQVGMGLGLMRAGLPGMIAAWVAFSGPSILLLLAAAAGLGTITDGSLGWLHGLLAGVVAIVAEAVWKMSRKLCPSRRHVTLALASAGAMIVFPHTLMQIAMIFGGALGGLLWLDRPEAVPDDGRGVRVSQATVVFGWATLIFGVALPVAWSNLSAADGPSLLNVYGAFSQTGALVFGGGTWSCPCCKPKSSLQVG